MEHARPGLLGKHPGYGDFLRHGLTPQLADLLTGWIDGTLTQLRRDLGGDWEAFWAGAQDLRFWLGAGVAGSTVIGVLRPWHDRVGRQYPLLLLAEAVAVPPPVADPDQAAWEALQAHLDRAQPGQGAKALLQGLSLDLPCETEHNRPGPRIWAQRGDGDLSALLAEAGPVDALCGATARSYWWGGGPGRAALWLGTAGFPGPAELAWLLTGQPAVGER